MNVPTNAESPVIEQQIASIGIISGNLLGAYKELATVASKLASLTVPSGEPTGEYVHMSVLHHYIRNQLTSILGYAEVIQEELDKSSPVMSDLRREITYIIQSAKTLEKLCDNNFRSIDSVGSDEAKSHNAIYRG